MELFKAGRAVSGAERVTRNSDGNETVVIHPQYVLNTLPWEVRPCFVVFSCSLQGASGSACLWSLSSLSESQCFKSSLLGTRNSTDMGSILYSVLSGEILVFCFTYWVSMCAFAEIQFSMATGRLETILIDYHQNDRISFLLQHIYLFNLYSSEAQAQPIVSATVHHFPAGWS